MSGTDPWKTAFRSPCFFGPPGTLFRPPRRAGTDTGTDLGKGFFLYARFFLPFCLFFAFLGFYLYVTAFPLCFTAFLPLVSGRILGKTCKTAVLWYPPGLFWLYFRPFSLSRPRHVAAKEVRSRLSEGPLMTAYAPAAFLRMTDIGTRRLPSYRTDSWKKPLFLRFSDYPPFIPSFLGFSRFFILISPLSFLFRCCLTASVGISVTGSILSAHGYLPGTAGRRSPLRRTDSRKSLLLLILLDYPYGSCPLFGFLLPFFRFPPWLRSINYLTTSSGLSLWLPVPLHIPPGGGKILCSSFPLIGRILGRGISLPAIPFQQFSWFLFPNPKRPNVHSPAVYFFIPHIYIMGSIL